MIPGAELNLARNAKKGALYVTGFSCAERSLFVAGKSPHKRKEIPMLPVQISPEKDELAPTFYLRLAYANGFSSVNDFLQCLYPTGNTITRNALSLNRYHPALENLIDIKCLDFTNQLTMFPFLYPFLQPHLIVSYTALINGYPERFRLSNSVIQSRILACPQCLKEKKLLRRYHYLPGVDMCPIHKIPLLDFGPMREIESIDLTEETGAPIEVKNGIDYSEWLYHYYLHPFQINRKDIEDWLNNPDVKNNSPNYYRDISVTSVDLLLPYTFKKMMKLFSSYDDAQRYFSEAYPWKPKIGSEYQFIEGGRCLFSVKHHCTNEFVVNEETLSHGLLCPICDAKLSTEKRVSQILKTRHSGYSLVEGGQLTSSKVLLRHDNCGAKRYQNVDHILVDIPCNCEFEGKSKKPISVKKLPPFQIMRYPVPKHNFLTLKHTACGNVFSMRPHPQYSCPFCDSTYVGMVYRAIIEHFDIGEFTLQELANVLELPVHQIKHALTVLTDKGHLRTRGIHYAIQN